MPRNGWREAQSEFKGFAKNEFKNINTKLDTLGKGIDKRIDKICEKIQKHTDKVNIKIDIIDERSKKNETALSKVFLIAGGIGTVFGIIGTTLLAVFIKIWNFMFK